MHVSIRGAVLALVLGLAGLVGGGSPGPVLAATAFDQAAASTLRGDAASAIRAYEQYEAEHPHDRLTVTALYAAANLKADALQDPAGALSDYERLLREHESSPFAADAARRRADCLSALERWNDAGQAYAEALTYATAGGAPRPPAWVNDVSTAASSCFTRGGDGARAIQAYESVLQRPLPALSAATLWLRHGDACAAVDRKAEAARSYLRVLTDYPFTELFLPALAQRPLIDQQLSLDWRPYELQARANRDMQAGSYAAARVRADSILAFDPPPGLRTAAESRRIVTRMLVESDFAQGRAELVAFADQHPEYRDLPNTQRFLQYTKDVVDAQASAAADTTDASASRHLGELFVNGRMTSLAIAPLERAHRLQPDDDVTDIYLGAAYLAVGRFEESDRLLRAYFDRNPDDTGTMNRMGYGFLQAGQPDRALPFFRMFADKAPEDPNAHDSLAEGLLAAGQLDEAVAEYETAVRLDPGFANSHFMRGEVYRRLDRPTDARQAYQRFLELSPTGTQAEEARAALGELGAGSEAGAATETAAPQGGPNDASR